MLEVKGGFTLRGFKGKGGGAARTPVEMPDSLKSTSYARVLDLLSEGPIKGLVDGAKSVYLDETPLQNADGSFNFSGVQFDFREGSQQQEHIAGFPATESTTGVGVELREGTPWVKSITNPALSAVRITLGVNGLSKVNNQNGDTNGYRVEYAIDLQTGGAAWQQVIAGAFDGKTTSAYRRTHRIDLPQGAASWQIRVRRITPNSSSGLIADTTVIESISEVIDGKFRYPMSAIAGLQIDASQFQSIPTRAYNLEGRIIKVPSNYDPVSRTYSGVWNGTFKQEYTNNPAWVFYDLVTHERYGLGKRIPVAWVNKWALYQIAAYCDEMVPDGKGGMEPRFTCNAYLQQRADAHRVLQDLASIFRGMIYWAAGTAEPVADIPRDPVYTYTQANVLDGKFTYTGSRLKDRYTVAIVSYCDMSDFGRQKVVYWEDTEAIAKYGIRKTEITAFGCSSEGQALRVAKWAILTSQRETRTVSFSVGLDGTLVAPGKIIRVADSALAGTRIGGRVVGGTSTRVIVDSPLQFAEGDKLSVVMPNGVVETRSAISSTQIPLTADTTQITSDTTQITSDITRTKTASTEIIVSPAFSATPEIGAVWTLESESLYAQLFNVLAVTQGDGLTFNITAIQHEPGKFEAIDYGTRLENRPVTIVPPKVQAAPSNLQITSREVLAQGVSSTTIFATWQAPQDAVAYDVEWRRDFSDWVRSPQISTNNFEIQNAYSGVYVLRVRAVNSINSPSVWVESLPTEVTGITTAPPTVTSLTTKPEIFGISLNWGFPAGRNILQRTEIYYSPSNEFENATKLGDYAYPQSSHTLSGLAAGITFYFWARLVDKNGTAGAWFGPVRGDSSADASAILDYITGQIGETQLSQELAQRIETTEEVAISAESKVTSTNEKLAAMYSVKVQVNQNGAYHFAGFGLGVENVEGNLQSQFLVSADRFAILPAITSGAGSAKSPFAVQNGQVFIDNAVIADASIGEAKIANAAITSAKIGSAQVDTLQIAGNAVTIPVSVSVNNYLQLRNTNWNSIGSLTTPAAAGGNRLVTFAVRFKTSVGTVPNPDGPGYIDGTRLYLRLLRNGVSVYGDMLIGQDISVSTFNFLYVEQSDTQATFEMQVMSSIGGTTDQSRDSIIYERVISSMTTKR